MLSAGRGKDSIHGGEADSIGLARSSAKEVADTTFFMAMRSVSWSTRHAGIWGGSVEEHVVAFVWEVVRQTARLPEGFMEHNAHDASAADV